MAELLQTQAAEGIRICLQYFEDLGTQKIVTFVKYLKTSKILKSEIQTEGLTKKMIMKQIYKNITIKDHESCETVLRWAEVNKQSLSSGANHDTYKKLLQYSLEELFHPPIEKKNLSQDDRKRLLQCLTASKYLSLKEETNNFDCIYQSISHSFESIDRSVGADDIRNKCLSFLKDKTIPLQPEQIKAILRSSSSIKDHITKLDGPRASGDPFIFYAAAMEYKVYVHVISAVSSQEYFFYPEECPSERAGYDHIYIGHLYDEYYSSLVNKVSVQVLMQKKKDLESLVKEYHDEVDTLQSRVNYLEAENSRLKSNDNVKLTKELKDRLQESEKFKQMLEDENKLLMSKIKSMDEVKKDYMKKEDVNDLLNVDYIKKDEIEKKYVRKDDIEKHYVKKEDSMNKSDVEALIYKITGIRTNEKETSNCNDPKPKEGNKTETQGAQAPQTYREYQN